MSKIGRLPVEITSGISITATESNIQVAGPKGTLFFQIPQGIEVRQEENKIIVAKKEVDMDPNRLNALFGLVRATVANMIEGVEKGFSKQLALSGVGYRAQTNGTELTLHVGFSHPVKIKALSGITFGIEENIITISGIDKTLVGEMAAKIRSIRLPEPYKGKGISYKGERIRRKAGKAAKAVGGK